MNIDSLALDPSLAETGYAIMREDKVIQYGTLKFKRKYSEAFKLKGLAEGLKRIIQEHNPQEIAIELPYVGKNPDTAIKLGGVRGIILLLAETNSLSVYEYTTFEIKKTVTDDHIADKKQVNRMVEMITGIKTDNYNISDAIAIGLCHSTKKKFNEIISTGH